MLPGDDLKSIPNLVASFNLYKEKDQKIESSPQHKLLSFLKKKSGIRL